MKPLPLAALLTLFAATTSPAQPIYFLVAEHQPLHRDSYVLPLRQPEHIAHARDIIARGPLAGRAIVVAETVPGADGINGDYIHPDTHLWPWHVSQFITFADITAEILDGWPGAVHPPQTIGFWGYTIKAELGPSVPEPSLAIPAILTCLTIQRRRHRALPR